MSVCRREISCYIPNQTHMLPMTSLCRSVYLCLYTAQEGIWFPDEIYLQLWKKVVVATPQTSHTVRSHWDQADARNHQKKFLFDTLRQSKKTIHLCSWRAERHTALWRSNLQRASVSLDMCACIHARVKPVDMKRVIPVEAAVMQSVTGSP